MTLAQFAEIFALLAVQLRQTDADEATIRAYYESLKDIEPEFLAWAAKKLAASAEWFPKTSEWREAAATVERDRIIAQKALLLKLPVALCLACRDTGWELVNGEPESVKRCDCQRKRRLEILGRSPWPELPEHIELPDPGSFEKVRQMIRPLLENT